MSIFHGIVNQIGNTMENTVIICQDFGIIPNINNIVLTQDLVSINLFDMLPIMSETKIKIAKFNSLKIKYGFDGF